ncbi:Uncharacterised protein [Vibrio cholerae]|nr:Uncharacterised protein [Vibrio cholerae]CSC40350.1 Uncharacterised protein [Vibrio cholerae]
MGRCANHTHLQPSRTAHAHRFPTHLLLTGSSNSDNRVQDRFQLTLVELDGLALFDIQNLTHAAHVRYAAGHYRYKTVFHEEQNGCASLVPSHLGLQ